MRCSLKFSRFFYFCRNLDSPPPLRFLITGCDWGTLPFGFALAAVAVILFPGICCVALAANALFCFDFNRQPPLVVHFSPIVKSQQYRITSIKIIWAFVLQMFLIFATKCWFYIRLYMSMSNDLVVVLSFLVPAESFIQYPVASVPFEPVLELPQTPTNHLFHSTKSIHFLLLLLKL